MKLEGTKIAAIQKALVSAFKLSELRQMVRFGLDEDLDDISIASDLKDAIFQLIEWAERQGKLSLLIQEAHKYNPSNPELKELSEEYQAKDLANPLVKIQEENKGMEGQPAIELGEPKPEIQRKSQKRNSSIYVPMIVAVISLLGVLLAGIISLYKVNIPIKATETAGGKLTALALAVKTPTFAIMPTATSPPTLTPTPTFTPTLSLEPTITITSTLEPTATPFYNVIFQDGFIDNANGWFNQSEEDPGGALINFKIAGGKYTHTITCPGSYQNPYCGFNSAVPINPPKNFYIQFDTKLKNASREAQWIIGVQYKRIGGRYYIAYFNGNGFVNSQLYESGQGTDLLERTPTRLIKTAIGETNTFGILANGSHFSLYVNEKNVGTFDDGNLKQPGNIYLVFFVYRGATVTFELDNFILGGL